MLPLVYRQLGDSLPRRVCARCASWACPVVTGGLAWVVGRSGGPLYVFTDTAWPDRRVCCASRWRDRRPDGRVLRVASRVAPRRSASTVLPAFRTWLGGSRPACTSVPPRDGARGSRCRAPGRGVWRMRQARTLDDGGRLPNGVESVPHVDRVTGQTAVRLARRARRRPRRRCRRHLPEHGSGGRVLGARRCVTWRTGWPSSGWAALRLDYAATGDSVGDWTDPDLVAEWLGNIRVAIDYVRPSGRRGSGWWGSGSAPRWRPPSSPAAGPWTTWCCGTRVRQAGRSSGSSAPSPPSGARRRPGRVEREARAPADLGRGRPGRGAGRRVLRGDRGRPRARGNRAERSEPRLPGARADPEEDGGSNVR